MTESYRRSDTTYEDKRITLGILKEQFCMLNMRMRLAMESHDPKVQEEIKVKMDELQEQMDRLGAGQRVDRG